MTTPMPPLADLCANPDSVAWFKALNEAGPADADLSWPDARTLDERLRFFGIPEDDIAIVHGLYPQVSGSPDLRWVVERSVRLVNSRMGQRGYSPLPALPAGFGEVGLHLHTFVYAMHFPATLAWHQARGIPLDVTQETMADIGHHYLVERHDRHRSGLAGGERWLPFHARGLIYQFGRLQFETGALEHGTAAAMRQAGVACDEGESVLNVHIPGLSGSFPPEACDASFARAVPFFARHFPDLGLRFATCDSWLLDPQLGDYLPESSNIMRFQRRFRLVPDPEPDNGPILNFVFRLPGTPVEALPQRTTLERAVVRHIQAGKTWRSGVGWLPLAPPGGKDSSS